MSAYEVFPKFFQIVRRSADCTHLKLSKLIKPHKKGEERYRSEGLKRL
jgi:hypothetical protein